MVEAQRKWNEENSRRVLAMEGSIQAAAVESSRYAKGKAEEFKETLEAYIQKAMSDLEAKMAKRIDAIRKFFDFLQKAKPGEDENWLKMMRILDAEVEKLKAQPKADGAFGQATLEEAKNQFKGHAAYLKQEFGGQFL